MPTNVTATVVEALTSPAAQTRVAGVLVETLTAPNLTNTKVSGAVVEVLVGPLSKVQRVHGAVVEVLCGPIPAIPPQPVNPFTYVAERLLGRDLVLPLPGRSQQPTPTGDWPIVSGRPNLRAAMVRRAIANPRSLAHRPGYGAGLELSVGQSASPARLADTAARLKANALRDPRVGTAKASLSAPDGRVSVELTIAPNGLTDADTIALDLGD